MGDAAALHVLAAAGFPYLLVVEQADAGEGHRHVVFVAGLDHVVVANGSARLRNIVHAALMCTLDIVTEREECV